MRAFKVVAEVGEGRRQADIAFVLFGGITKLLKKLRRIVRYQPAALIHKVAQFFDELRTGKRI